MPKDKKQRAEHYDPKLVVKGTFLDVIKASVNVGKKQPTTKAEKKS